MQDSQDPRDAIIAELRAYIEDLREEAQQIADVTDQVMEQQEQLHALELEKQANRLKVEALERDNAFKREVNAVYTSTLETQQMVLATLQRAKSERVNGTSDVLPHLEALSSKIADLGRSVELVLDGGHPGPLLSVTLEEWTKVRGGLGIDGKKIDTDYNRIKDFITFAGDKPINKYRYLDFQSFANMLVHVPASYSVKPEFRSMTQAEAMRHNDGLPPAKRHKTLTGKTIETNYLSPLNMIFHDMCAHHNFPSPLANVTIRISNDARDSTDRLPFAVPELNKWFAHAATEDRGDNKWLPLLGTVTGARIGELIRLQAKDIYQVEGGHWVLDLTTDLVTPDGLAVARRVKTKSSRRIIAIHQAIVDAGFIEYVKTFPKDGWIFPWAFYHGKEKVKRPADAASKRLNGQLKKIGIHKEIESTFHSSRHTAKDIMRVARIDQRTHDLQTGHKLKTVSDNYGAKRLKREELEVLTVLPLPEGLDLSPYMRVSAIGA
ncbi:tyrosine-type recombinase/integrase [Agrobacterium sp. FDAARGOS_525]|uniref:site-specific integrase n=1 Tax=Agrobacterium sp. FDAARGOS_525 TaxID=2420311 RepID=UPI0015621F11|nr:tyrosine-type recombinase/integrase [Agrobacterium sp. FDAARGOS_525]